jgi:multidrug resistance efflux pump
LAVPCETFSFNWIAFRRGGSHFQSQPGRVTQILYFHHPNVKRSVLPSAAGFLPRKEKENVSKDSIKKTVPGNDSHRTTRIFLIIVVSLFVWYVVSDRLTPYTAAARLQGFVIPIVPDVSGYIQDIPVRKYQLAQAGDKLLQIETHRFELALRQAEATLEVAGQDVGAGTEVVTTAAAQLSQAKVELEVARTQGARVLMLEQKGITPRAQGDQARAVVASREAKVGAAQAELNRARKSLGTEGEQNPRVQLALARVEEAQLNLARTTVGAPGQGYVGSLYLDEGAFAPAGQPVMTFISLDEYWIEAYLTENNLGRVDIGNEVDIAFDVFPGKIFHGKIKKIAPGVSTGKKTDLGDLSAADKTNSWLRSPQRFSVIIQPTDSQALTEAEPDLRLNSQADVIVYTGKHWFWNSLAWLWIRFVSLLSYLY